MLSNRTLSSTLDRMLTLNRALDEAFSAGAMENRVWVPAIDVVETQKAYVLYAELSGVDPSEIDIKFEQNVSQTVHFLLGGSLLPWRARPSC